MNAKINHFLQETLLTQSLTLMSAKINHFLYNYKWVNNLLLMPSASAQCQCPVPSGLVYILQVSDTHDCAMKFCKSLLNRRFKLLTFTSKPLTLTHNMLFSPVPRCPVASARVAEFIFIQVSDTLDCAIGNRF